MRLPRLVSWPPYADTTVSHGVLRLVFTAGACPLDESGDAVAVGDVVTQGSEDESDRCTDREALAEFAPRSGTWLGSAELIESHC